MPDPVPGASAPGANPGAAASDAPDLDLAAPDALASMGDTGTSLGPGDLYDPTEDPTAGDDAAALDAGITAQPSDPLGIVGASDEVLGDLTGEPDDFGPGSGRMGDSNTAVDET